jgi:uncharacterized protein (DUF2141 family)
MFKNISFFLTLVLLVAGLVSCANQGYPEGGPRDETPPRMVSSRPPINAINFDGDKIEIEFDELIVLKEALQKVVVSPPLTKTPTIRGLGNKITVIFDEDLQPGTTYSVDFADAIQDNNEGNPLEGFTFSFSTGETKDTLQISGHVFEANTLTPVAGVLVMVHSNPADSAFTKMVPPRLAKTNEEGAFTIRNLAEGQYRVYALEDLNRNYRFDQPGERIAWLNETVKPSFEYRERVDSLFKDTITLDTVLITQELVYLPDSIKLFLFQEDYKTQYLDTRERKERNRLDFYFNRPLEKPLEVAVINAKPKKDNWFVYERSVRHDSVMIWLADSALISLDSLTIKATYPVLDSLENFVDKIDTLKMFHRTIGEKKKRKRKDEEQLKEEPLVLRSPEGDLDIGATAWLSFPVPVAEIHLDSITVSMLVDSLYQPVEFNVEQDSIHIRNFKIIHDWLPNREYKLDIDSAAFRDIYDRVNRPVSSVFRIKSEDSYSTLYVGVKSMSKFALMQILDSKEQIIRKGRLPENGKLAFRYLPPGKYFLKIVDDIDENGKWDTGKFSEDLQPERVYYYPEVVKLRANWSQEVSWDVDEYPIYEFVKRNRMKKEKSSNSQNRK